MLKQFPAPGTVLPSNVSSNLSRHFQAVLEDADLALSKRVAVDIEIRFVIEPKRARIEMGRAGRYPYVAVKHRRLVFRYLGAGLEQFTQAGPRCAARRTNSESVRVPRENPDPHATLQRAHDGLNRQVVGNEIGVREIDRSAYRGNRQHLHAHAFAAPRRWAFETYAIEHGTF